MTHIVPHYIELASVIVYTLLSLTTQCYDKYEVLYINYLSE